MRSDRDSILTQAILTQDILTQANLAATATWIMALPPLSSSIALAIPTHPGNFA